MDPAGIVDCDEASSLVVSHHVCAQIFRTPVSCVLALDSAYDGALGMAVRDVRDGAEGMTFFVRVA